MKNLYKWFYAFWINNYRVSFILIILIILYWVFSLFTIPKESSPDIKFWMISVTTIYQWVNPVDIDSLITDKIEKEIKDVDWIKKISSTSSIWISNIVVELENWINTREATTDIKSKIDSLKLPDDAEKPNVTEISSNNELLFEVALYWDLNKFNEFDLTIKAKIIKDKLEWKNNISSIDIWTVDMNMWSSNSNTSDYEIKVLLSKQKIESLWLSINDIANKIRIYNKNTPIWNYKVWDLNYDFRFDWELKDLEELNNIILSNNWVSSVKLSDISTIKKEYKNDDIRRLWFYNSNNYNYIPIIFNKEARVNVFDTSTKTKEELEKLLKSKEFEWLWIKYSKDMADRITKDYGNLASTANSTVILVFITILFFVWFKESLIASFLIPLSFLITFIVLDLLWLSLNFLTNFSLVLTLWIAIDTVIVIIEWASEKLKMWYDKKTSVLLAVKEFKAPLISWTMTTLVVFLPMMFLPWILWKFLAYIPITIFSTLLAWLVLSLTLSSALFYKLVKEPKFYHLDEEHELHIKEEYKKLLEEWRKNKQPKWDEWYSIREKILNKMWDYYFVLMKSILNSSSSKMLLIFVPIILLIFSFVVIAPKIWFTLFPKTDEWVLEVSLKTKVWSDKDVLVKYIDNINNSLNKIKEINSYTITINWNKLSAYIELIDKDIRKEKQMKNVFEVEKIVSNDLNNLKSYWIEVEVWTLKNWPPSWSSIWIKLISNSAKNFDTLKEVSEDFKKYLRTIKWTKNVNSTSDDTPWQFIFSFDNEKLSNLWLTPNDILSELYFYTNWIKVWSIKSNLEDNNIIISLEEFENELNPKDIEDLVINTKVWNVRVWDFANYNFVKSVSAITREKWKVIISVNSDSEVWFLPTDIQPKLEDFAKKYNFPEWISYSSWWEQSENMDLIISTLKSLIISIFLIFLILVLQFNSISQPLIIMYSIVLALLWVNFWLYLTWNPYSMPFGIWFIALTWVVVNDAIILIDRLNMTMDFSRPLSKSEVIEKISLAWKTRLQPIIVTTLTTVFWILPLAMQDEFWAWLWYTIVFGLTVASFMTLFAIPILYSWSIKRKITYK